MFFVLTTFIWESKLLISRGMETQEEVSSVTGVGGRGNYCRVVVKL